MRVLRIAWTEVRRLGNGRARWTAVVALALIPLLYGATYIDANWDPQGGFGRVPAAVVVEDSATTAPDGTRIDAGPTIAAELVRSRVFSWDRVDAATARRGLADGRYAASLTIPAGFSAALSSAAQLAPATAPGGRGSTADTPGTAARGAGSPTDPAGAGLVLAVDDSGNHLAGTSAQTLVAQVRTDLARATTDAGVRALIDGLRAMDDRTGQAARAAARLDRGAAAVRSATADAGTGAVRVRDGATATAAGVARLAGGAGRLADGLGAMDRQVAELPASTRRLAGGAGELADGTAQMSAGAGRLVTGAGEVSAGAGSLSVGADRVADGNARVAAAGRTAASSVHEARGQLATRRTDLLARLGAAGATPAQLATVRDVLDRAGRGLADVDRQAAGTAAQLEALARGSREVAAGSRELSRGADRLHTGARRLDTGAGRAATGARRIATGTAQLADDAPALAAGVGRAAGSATTVASGADRAATATRQVAAGAAQLAGRPAGPGRAATGTAALQAGTGQLSAGTTRLAVALDQGARVVPDIDDRAAAATATRLADPVALRTIRYNAADPYGATLAPFFLGLALWIGAFAAFLLIVPLSSRALAAGATAWRVALAGWLPAAALGLIQAVALGLAVRFGVGLHPARAAASAGVLALTALAFTAAVHGLVAAFGPRGKFGAVVLLVLQLVSAGGTSPWQTTPLLIRLLHEVLPMGYVVDALRLTLFGGPPGRLLPDLAVLGAYLVGGLALATLAAARSRTWTVDRLQPELAL